MNTNLAALLLSLVAVLAACGSATPTSSPTAVETGAPAPTAGSPIPLPVVITTDLGMDDLLALYILLRDPAVDIRAITVDGTGIVHCGPGLRNVRRILTAFGRE
ncbi:MAG TPA: hypothetical protein VFY23_00790, partial [Candidatus Limnocylindrales bacterium]|nr:hypothetical protein [Candidatus Limnocylindrales bacterium]